MTGMGLLDTLMEQHGDVKLSFDLKSSPIEETPALIGSEALGGILVDDDDDEEKVSELSSDATKRNEEEAKVRLSSSKEDVLTTSMVESEILLPSNHRPSPDVESWDSETDALLDSILTGSADKLVLSLDGGPLSDTSSDSGCNLLSPHHYEPLSVTSPERPSSIDFIGYLSNDDDEQPLQAVDPVSVSSPDEERINVTRDTDEEEEDVKPPITRNSPLQAGGTTTILLPVIKSVRQTVNLNSKNGNKRRRISASSSDSGVDDGANTTTVHSSSSSSSSKQGKYLALELTAEEQRLCEREGIKLPSHYPLSREEEKNLKRIRRKIRNKESAQHSRRRKKEYVDSMEDRVRLCTEENDELKSKIELLETQNKTLASQLRRLHQIIVNGGGFKQNQTSTAMMVLLLSTALFLIPGFQKQTETKPELDIPQAVKVPPIPGQSRSLLQFSPASSIKQEFAPAQDAPDTSSSSSSTTVGGRSILGKRSLPHFDHDYLSSSSKKLNSYIEDDAAPRGYGPGIETKGLEDRRLNVNVSHSAVRTVVLHVPKDIK